MISLICEILKNDTNEFICKTEIDSQTQENTYGYEMEKQEMGKDKLGVWD